jgi:dTDP-glucose 4,6-dehydratase
VSMIDLVNTIIDIMGQSGRTEPDVLLTTKIQNEIDEQYLDSSKVTADLGWRPEVSLAAGIEKTVEWYRANWGRKIQRG